ncbi:MAG: Gfo/Idh/MocA family oxidoreductase [Actinomycetota bacterium]
MAARSADQPLRIGFLGAGLIATYHSKSLRRSGVEAAAPGWAGTVRAGVYDPDGARAAAFAAVSGHTVCASEEAVLDSCDAVYVCTWTSEHPRLVAAAAERGLAVFCEKPLAIDLTGASDMARVVAEAGVVNQTGLVLRHSPAYLWAQHLITDRAAGRVMTVVFRDDQFIPIQGHYSSTWRADRNRAGAGTLLEHSIHDIDMLRYLIGDVARVSTNTANFHGHDGIEDVASATFRFTSGATGTLTSVWHDNLARPSLRRVEVFCARRMVVIEGDDWFGPVSWTDADGTVGTLEGEALADAVDAFRDGSSNPDGEFVRAVAAGRPAHPDFGVALEAHRIVDAMYRSAAGDGTMERIDD